MLIRFTLMLQILTIPAALAATEIALEEAPPEVLQTAIATAPGVDFLRVTIEAEDGRRVYEFEGRGPSGEHIEIDVYENGDLKEIEMEIAASDLPGAVRASLEEAAPGLEIAYVETSIRMDGVFVYEIEGRMQDGDRLAIDIREDGRILRRESAATS